MADTDTLPAIPIDAYNGWQSDQFQASTDQQIASIGAPPSTPGGGFDPSSMGSRSTPSPAPPIDDTPALTPDIPAVPPAAGGSDGPQPAAASSPPSAAPAAASAPAPVTPSSPLPADLSPVLNAASAAGVDPGVFVAAHQSGAVDPSNLFDSATKLAGHIQDAGGDLVKGLQAFTGSPAKAASVLDKAIANLNPTPAPAASSSTGNPTGAQGTTQTTAEISGGGKAVPLGDAAHAIMSAGANAASWLGEQGQKALQAVLVTEGGMTGARGDNGNSAGPLQFYSGGQLANFAAQHNMSQADAKTYVEAHPNDAVQWAIGTPDKPGYLGGAIQAGLNKGLSGGALATYAQQHGQVSVSPERAGQNFNALFGNGSGPVTGSDTTQGPARAGGAIGDAQASGPTQTASSVSQFGDKQLSSDEAYSACGPAAAVRFAQAEGRNPTLREATDLAKTVGWTSAQGMAGLNSEKALMDKLQIPTKVVGANAIDAMAREAQTGNPVTISTANHYFYADGYNPDTGAFHVGQSGLDLKGGSEWMTPAQMQAKMGAIQGGLLADNPTVQNPSTVKGTAATSSPTYMSPMQPADAADRQAQAVQGPPTPAQDSAQPTTGNSMLDWLGQQKDALASAFGGVFNGNGASPVPAPGGGYDPSSMIARAAPTDTAIPERPVGADLPSGGPTVGDTVNDFARNGPIGAVNAGLQAVGQTGAAQVVAHTLAPYITTGQLPPDYSQPMTPEQLGQQGLNVGGVEMGGDMHGLTDAAGNAIKPVGEALTGQAGDWASNAVSALQGILDRAKTEGTATPETIQALQSQIDGMKPQAETAQPTITFDPEAAAKAATQSRARARAALDPGAITAPEVNPFQLATEPGPGRTLLAPDEALSHLESLDQLHQANDLRINELENRLQGGKLGTGDASGTVVRPNWAAGYSDDALRNMAQANGLNPYDATWGNKIDPQYLSQQGFKGTGTVKQTPTQMRQELAQLRITQQQIVAATDHAFENGGADLYRHDTNPNSGELPWQEYTPPDDTAAVSQTQSVATADATARPTDTGQAPQGANPSVAARDAGQQQVVQPPPVDNTLERQFAAAQRAEQASASARIKTAQAALDRVQQGVDTLSARAPGNSVLADINQELQNAKKAAQSATQSQASQFDRALAAPSSAVAAPAADAAAASPAIPEYQRIAQEYVDKAHASKPTVADTPAPTPSQLRDIPESQPPTQYDPTTNTWTNGEPDGPTPMAVTPPPARATITPDLVQAAHERIDKAFSGDVYRQDAAHTTLDQMLANGATPDALARFLSGEVEGNKTTIPGVIRQVRTGSMAGGLVTMGKVAAGPIVQTAMRAPVAAIKAVVSGKAGDIPAGLQGGLGALSQAATEGLQTMKYGINDRAALLGGSQGGYGFAPGIDVMSPDARVRALGTIATGLVRAHGAVSDVSSAIGRGAAAATGATPEAAQQVGQQWALRSGQYGSIGQAVSNALEGIKKTNPALDVMGQILIPFYRVGYNAFTQGVERSPVGALGTAADVARAQLPASAPAWLKGPYAAGADASKVTPVGDRIANNMFGVGLAGVGLAQAAQGNITGENPTGGAPKWSMRVPETAQLGPLETFAKRDSQGNLWVPLRAVGPAGEALAQSAILYEAARDGKGNVATEAAKAAGSYAGHVYDETWLRNVGDLFNLAGETKSMLGGKPGAAAQARKNMQYTVGGLAKSFVPQDALGGQVARMAGVSGPGAQPVAPAKSTARPAAPAAPVPVAPNANPYKTR